MYSAVLDTNVIFGNYLRDTLLRLALAGLYRPLWSAHILDELRGNLSSHTDPASAARVISLMDEHFPDAKVTGHEELIGAMTNDPKDRHVLAAAVRANAATIVTSNVRDFPAEAVQPYGLAIVTPDDFLLDQLTLREEQVRRVLGDMVADYDAPAMALDDLADRLEPDAPRFASEIRTS